MHDRYPADCLGKNANTCCSHCVTCGLRAQSARLQQLLRSRTESVVGEVLRSQPVPKVGLRVVRGEEGLIVRLTEPGCNPARCRRLQHFVSSLANKLPPMSLAERLEVLVRRLMQTCMLGPANLAAKQRQLKVLGWLSLWLLQRQARPVARLDQQLRLLSGLIHEPEKRMRSLWREHLFWFQVNYARRLLHLENRPGSLAYLQTFFWPDKSDYQRNFGRATSSRVLLSIHMGDFFGGFRLLAMSAEPGRQVISLRRDAMHNHGMQHFAADRVEHEVFYHDQQHATTIVGALRRGGHTLATLFDLKDDFGSTVIVNFFGHRARFVKGPVQLAIMGRCPIFPFVCFEWQGRNCIEMAPVIDTRLRSGESLHCATVRITQELVKRAEGWIRRCPSQWKYLPVLPTYFEAAR